MNIEEEVRKIVAEELGADLESVTADTAAGSAKGWDSVKTVMILSAVQERLGVQFPDEDLFDLVSVAAIAAEVAKVTGA